MSVQRKCFMTARAGALLYTLFASVNAWAQISQEVVVGVTPTCPYGIGACAAGAREGLLGFEGVQLVADIPDKYNATFEVRLREAKLPDIERWQQQFEAVVGNAFGFRGVEVTVTGSIINQSGVLALQVAELQRPIALAPLNNKLQWNFRKGAARQPEPAEAQAYQELVEETGKASSGALKVEVIGPLRNTKQGPVIQVREYYLSREP